MPFFRERRLNLKGLLKRMRTTVFSPGSIRLPPTIPPCPRCFAFSSLAILGLQVRGKGRERVWKGRVRGRLKVRGQLNDDYIPPRQNRKKAERNRDPSWALTEKRREHFFFFTSSNCWKKKGKKIFPLWRTVTCYVGRFRHSNIKLTIHNKR